MNILPSNDELLNIYNQLMNADPRDAQKIKIISDLLRKREVDQLIADEQTATALAALTEPPSAFEQYLDTLDK